MTEATHTDRFGMPVAFSPGGFPFHPTPCCGAAASAGDGGLYCKACYEALSPEFGGHPAEPFTPMPAHDRSAWDCDEPYDGATYAERSCPICGPTRTGGS